MKFFESPICTPEKPCNFNWKKADPIALQTWGLVSTPMIIGAGLLLLFIVRKLK